MHLTTQDTSHSMVTGPPAGYRLVHSNREESTRTASNDDHNDGVGLNSSERHMPDNVTMHTRKRPLRVGTWNVRTLFQAGKLDNLILEANRLNCDDYARQFPDSGGN